MAVVRSQDSYSSSSSFSSNFTYDVFLSFRGVDTRKTFTDHLYTALVNAGLNTFRDDDEIRMGENIKSELEEAIKSSKSSVIVLSKNYASSGWCLDELVLILGQKKSSGHIVVPVFYDIDPTNIRRQTGNVSEAFARHEERIKAEANDRKREDLMNKVQGWRSALKEVADLSGRVLKTEAEGYESKFIQKVVSFVENKVARNYKIHVTPYLVGIHYRVENINKWLSDGSTEVGIAAISGMGGLGKTTVAKCVYNMNFEKFSYKSFLEEIRENFRRPDGLLHLQRQLLSDFLTVKVKKINNVNEGMMKIKQAISRGRVLVVLDDVDQISQMEAIFGMREWFYPGSKIIITTRNKQLLKAHGPCNVYAVEEMDFNESLELFSLYAFGDKQPDEHFLKLSTRIIRHCQGLPLALKVLGSSLRGTSEVVWRSLMEKLKVLSDANIQDILRISYDSLQDDHDRELFLDIACFFIGESIYYVIGVMNECGYYTEAGIENLKERCLLWTDKDDRLRLHQLVESMAKEIIREQSPKELGKRSRLWLYKDSFRVLMDETGTETIEGLSLNMKMLREDKLAMRSLNIYDGSGASLKTSAFTRMRQLRLIQINYVKLTGGYKDFPKNLRWLSWHGFPLRSLPPEFPLQSMVAIDMRYSKLSQFWHGKKSLGLLKFLNLSHCHDLLKSPDFSKLPALEDLKLKDCVGLVEIDESIEMAEGLVYLNLENCKKLKKLPRNIVRLKFLETLIISGCCNLERMPTEEMNKMESLKVFHADWISFGPVAPISQENTTWRELIRGWLTPLEKYSQLQWPSFPRSLVSLSLVGSNLSDDVFPRNFSGITSLQFLDLSRNPISFFPDCFKGLTQINMLVINHCPRLQALGTLPSVVTLNVLYCPSLEQIAFQPSATLPRVLDGRCFIWYCKKLLEFDQIYKLDFVEKIDPKIINNMGIYELMDSLKSTHIKLYNNYTMQTTEGPIKGLHEMGQGGKLFSIFFPGNRVPSWYATKSSGSSIAFTVTCPPTANIRCLNICFVYDVDHQKIEKEHALGYFGNFYVLVHNKTEDRKIAYHPTFHCIPDEEATGEFVIWLSQWRFASHELEVGDEMIVSEFVMDGAGYEVKEVGIQLVLDENDDEEQVQNAGLQSNGREYCPSDQYVVSPENPRLIGHQGSTPIYIVGCGASDILLNFIRESQQVSGYYKRYPIAVEEEWPKESEELNQAIPNARSFELLKGWLLWVMRTMSQGRKWKLLLIIVVVVMLTIWIFLCSAAGLRYNE